MATDEQFRQQVDILIRVLPSVAEENVFALKGGTAITLFVRDLPRLPGSFKSVPAFSPIAGIADHREVEYADPFELCGQLSACSFHGVQIRQIRGQTRTRSSV